MTSLLTTFLLLVLLVLPAVVSVRVSGWFFGEAEWWRRALAAGCIYPLVIWGVLMLLAPFELMRLWPVLLAMAILSAVTFLLPRGRWRRIPLEPRESGKGWQLALAAGVVCAALGTFALRLYFEGSTYLSDDYAYHGPTLAEWYQTGSVDHPRIMFPAYYPYNAHLVTYYMLLPTGDLRWTWLATLFWICLGVAAILVMALSLPRFSVAWGLVAAALFLYCREIDWFYVHTLCPTDVIGTVLLLSAFVCAIPREGASLREFGARTALAALLIGLVVGTKANYALPGVIAAVGVFAMSVFGVKQPGWSRRLGLAAILLPLGAFATGSYWYIWNWVHAKNPLFPVRFLNLRGPGNEKAWGETTLMHFIQQSPMDPAMWKRIVWLGMDWPHVLGFIALGGMLFGIGFSVRQVLLAVRCLSPQPIAHPIPWMVAAGLAMLAQYPHLPYSGTIIGGTTMIVAQRYFFFLFVVGLILAVYGISRLATGRRAGGLGGLLDTIGFGVLILLALLCLPRTAYTFWAVLFGMGVAAAIGWSFWSRVPIRLPSGPFARPLCAGMVLMALVFAGVVREQIVPGPYMTVADFEQARDLVPAMRRIDDLPPRSRIGQFTLNSWEYWYLYGSHFQHRPVILWESGEAMIALHEAYYGRLLDRGYPRLGVPGQDRLPNPETFAENLADVPLDYLFISRYVTRLVDDTWPPHRPIVREMPQFKLIWADGYSEIYRRVDPPARTGGAQDQSAALSS